MKISYNGIAGSIFNWGARWRVCYFYRWLCGVLFMGYDFTCMQYRTCGITASANSRHQGGA